MRDRACLVKAMRPVVILLMLAALSLSLAGCGILSQQTCKKVFAEFQPATIKAEGKIDAKVRLVTSHELSPERFNDFTSAYMGNKETTENYCKAMGELVYEDMVRSGLFASVNASSANQYDALIKVVTFEDRIGDQYKAKIEVAVLDNSGKELIATYTREKGLAAGSALTAVYGSAYDKREYGSWLISGLASIRSQMLADLKDGNGIRTALAVKRATAVSQGLAQQTQSAQTPSDYAAAWSALRQALAQDQRSPAPALAAATLLARLCDAEGARAMQAEAQRRGAGGAAPQPPAEPDPRACQAQALNKDGVALARQGSAAEAMAKFDQALKTVPAPLPKANYNAALVLEQQGQAQAAVRQYLAAYQSFLLPAEQTETLNRLLALSQHAKLGVPEAADQRYRLGVVRAKQNRHAEAVTEFEAALQEAPWLVDAYYNLGLVYDFVNRPADALRVLSIYVQLAPNSPNLGPVKTKIVELKDKLGMLSPK